MRTQELYRAAERLAVLLVRRERRIVFAESCTGGLVSATLARVPGISAHHCGSAVVYRIETKAEWLGVSRELLHDPGPVSEAVAAAMASGVLSRTPEAHLAVSVTGHLGPNAPPEQDGLILISAAQWPDESRSERPVLRTHEHWLERGSSQYGGRRLRQRRQIAAAALVLQTACETLEV